MSTLLIPAAGKSSRFPNMRPKWLLTHPTGDSMIKKVLDASRYQEYDKVVICILREHCEKYGADTIIQQIFGSDVQLVILENPTSSAAETVYEAMKRAELSGQVVIKDSDCIVRTSSPSEKNSIVGMQVDNKSDIDKIQTKSFIVKNDDGIIIDIVEKEVVSNIICLGVYSVLAEDFMSAFEDVSKSFVYKEHNEIYVSHIISYLILQQKKIFNYIECEEFVDWGTKQDWMKERSKFKTYIFDIDGVLLKNYGKYGVKNWSNTFEPIEENVSLLKRLSDAGHEIVFMTSRDEVNLVGFLEYIDKLGIKYKSVVSGCYHGKRILINDFAATNPWPSCEAISIKRNDLLGEYID